MSAWCHWWVQTYTASCQQVDGGIPGGRFRPGHDKDGLLPILSEKITDFYTLAAHLGSIPLAGGPSHLLPGKMLVTNAGQVASRFAWNETAPCSPGDFLLVVPIIEKTPPEAIILPCR